MQLPGNRAWKWVVINCSGGKDSQVALGVVVSACRDAGIPQSRIVVSYQCLGKAGWKGTRELVREWCDHYGLRMEVASYRNREGEQPTLLDHVLKREKWPSSTARYCTSDHKRGPGGRVITKLWREDPGPVLQVFGFRAEESTARGKRAVFEKNNRHSTKIRDVYDWNPIHTWTEEEVWEYIHAGETRYHPAYDLGMPRLSCVFCIFAPKPYLVLAGRHNPELLDEYCEVEEKINHTFRKDLSLREVREAVRSGEEIKNTSEKWNM